MVGKIKELLQKTIFADDISLSVRRTNTMLIFGFMVATGCTIMRILEQSPTLAIINQFAFIVLVLIAAVVFNKFKLRALIIYATIFMLNFVLLPITLFTNGGWSMDMSGFFAMGLAIIVMLIPGRRAIIFVAIDVVWVAVCYMFLLSHPE